MLKEIMSILGIRKQTRIAKVTNHSVGANLIVQTTMGREIIKGVTEIIDCGEFIVFHSNGISSSNGGMVAKHNLISAIPE